MNATELVDSDEHLRAAVEREQGAMLWGSEYRITPRLIAKRFGDGRALLVLEPLATRPNFYVFRGDSSALRHTGYGVHVNDEWMHEHLEEVMEAAEDEHGRAEPDPDDIAEGLIDDGDTWPFPHLNDSCGMGWGFVFPDRLLAEYEAGRPASRVSP